MHAHEGCPEYALTIYDIQGHKLIRKCCFATVLSVGLHPEECQVVTTSFAASLGLLTTSGGLSKNLRLWLGVLLKSRACWFISSIFLTFLNMLCCQHATLNTVPETSVYFCWSLTFRDPAHWSVCSPSGPARAPNPKLYQRSCKRCFQRSNSALQGLSHCVAEHDLFTGKLT